MGRRVLWGVLIGFVVLGWGVRPVGAQPLESILILDGIPSPYRLGKVEKVFEGPPVRMGAPRASASPGVVGPAGHFPENDTTFEVTYFSDDRTRPSPTVQITLHSSSQWLGHEVEGSFRDSDEEKPSFGMLHKGARLAEISGNRVYRFWGTYTWLSGTKVVRITYSDPRKPEPIEVVQAYLQKYPSSITLTDAELKSASHTESWLKNEMERRVWLMEKWVSVGSADVLKQAEAERAILEHAEVFSKYMYKYLGDSPNELIKGFFLASRPPNWAKLTAEVSKLRSWWDANKTRPLLISGIPSSFRLAEGWPILLGGLGAARQLWVERGRVSGYLGRWFTKER